MVGMEGRADSSYGGMSQNEHVWNLLSGKIEMILYSPLYLQPVS